MKKNYGDPILIGMKNIRALVGASYGRCKYKFNFSGIVLAGWVK